MHVNFLRAFTLDRGRVARLPHAERLRHAASGAYPRIEPENFRTDSSHWRETALPCGARLLANAAGDAVELLAGPFAGEQFFTLKAALEATSEAGKRIPGPTEWRALAQPFERRSRASGNGWADAPKAALRLGLPLAGYVEAGRSGAFRIHRQGAVGRYWCAPAERVSHAVFTDFGMARHDGGFGRCLLSVRCLAGS